MDFQEALEHALNGDAVLFVGAGFSLGATNGRGAPMKTGTSFAAHLAAEARLTVDTELQDAAEAYVDLYGPDELAKELVAEFRATDVAKHHRMIAGVPWRRVYTTNYDTIFELASSREGRGARPITLSERPGDVTPTEFVAVHFNGYVERITGTAGDEIRLTDSSYITNSVEASSWSAAFRQDLEIVRAVFFVGYSIADLDIARLIASTEQLQEKAFFIVGPAPSVRTVSRASRYGTVQRFDAAWFSRQIESKCKKYRPPDRRDQSWFCLTPYPVPNADSTLVSDKAVFDLFAFGMVHHQLLWNSLEGISQPYVVRRTAATTVLQRCKDTSRIVAVYGALGNGKSLLLETIKTMAAKEGMQVFTLTRRSPSLKQELMALVSINKPYLLVIDDYPSWFDAMDLLGTHQNKPMSLVVAARTSTHDVSVDRLEECFQTRNVDEFCADKLLPDELSCVDALLANYGLWGEKAGLSPTRRIRYLNTRGKSEWQSILLDLFEAPQIKSRMTEAVGVLNSRKGYYEILAAILVLVVLNTHPSLNLLMDLFGSRVMDRGLQKDQVVREFVDFQRGEVLCRSAVAARFMLGQVLDPNVLTEVLVALARALNKCLNVNRYYAEILRSLVQFSELESVLPNRSLAERRTAVFRYYERIRELDYCKRNPQFWLQYAISSLVFEDIDRSEKYFESAYSFARQISGYDTHKIDNHYARLLLQRAARSESKDAGIQFFRRAREIVFRQIQSERLHYPYRVARAIGDFFDAFAPSFNAAEREEIKNAALFIVNRIERLPTDLQQHRSVRECLTTMMRLLSLIDPSVRN